MQCALIDDAIMSRNEAMERLTRIARTTINDVIETKQVNWGTDEQPDIQVMWQLRDDAEALDAVSEIGAGPAGPKVKLHDPLKAIKQMAEMNGWNANIGVDVNQSGGNTIEGDVIDVKSLSNDALHELVMLQYATPPDGGDSA
jgi:phage terminase small subunit